MSDEEKKPDSMLETVEIVAPSSATNDEPSRLRWKLDPVTPEWSLTLTIPIRMTVDDDPPEHRAGASERGEKEVESEWLALTPFQDLVFWVHVRDHADNPPSPRKPPTSE